MSPPQAEVQASLADPVTAKARIYAMLDTDGGGVASRHDYFVRIDRAQQATGRRDDDPLVMLRAPRAIAPGPRWMPTATA
ncbi:hypothetical protein [Streptomyces sp. NPDC002671]